MKTSAGNYK